MNRLNKERGVSLVIVVMVMFILLGVAAFVVDFGFNYVQRNRLQNWADAAALAGVDTVYRANSISGFPNSPFNTNAEAAVIASLASNGYTYDSTRDGPIVVNWWDNAAITPTGKFHYPAVKVTLAQPSPLFFGKIFNNPDVPNLAAAATATAVTSYPKAIQPMLPFVITYCTLFNGWDPATSQPIGGGYTFYSGASTGASNQWNPSYNCVANNIKGTATKDTDTPLIVTEGTVQKLASPVPSNVTGGETTTLLKDELGYIKNGTSILSVAPTNGKICTNTAPVNCTYTLTDKINKFNDIPNTDTITSDSGPLGNWSPLVYDTSNAGGANLIGSYIPPVTATSVPLVSIGQEIRITPGAPDTLYQQIQNCFSNNTCKNHIAIPVVNGTPCLSGTSCPATSTTDESYPLTGIPIVPIGVGLNNNLPVLGYACINITSVSTGADKYFSAELTTGCHLSGIGGGTLYYGVLLPPVLAN